MTRDIPAPRPPPTHRCPAALPPAAVDTFLKIAQKCRRKFVQLQPNESQAFIEELCTSLPGVIADLEAHQVHTFYEAAGCMVAAHTDPAAREYLTGEARRVCAGAGACACNAPRASRLTPPRGPHPPPPWPPPPPPPPSPRQSA